MKKYIKGLNYTLLVLILVTIISKVLGMLRETSLAFFFGTNSITDTFVLSTTIPSVIFGCLDAISIAIIPIYMEKFVENEKRANKLLNGIISWVVVISILLLIIFEMISSKIVNLFMIGNANSIDYNMLLLFFRITLFTVCFNPIAQIYLSYLRCKGKTITAQIIELLISGVQIIFIVIAGISSKNIFLPIGYVVAQMSCMFFSYIFAKNKWFFKLTKKNEIKEIIGLVFPTFLGNTIIQINTFIDKLFASTLRGGSIASLNYSNIVKNLFYAIFTAPMINIWYPKISYHIANGKKKMVSELLNNIINKTTFFLFPVVFYTVIFATPVIQFLFLRGNFDYESLTQTSIAFQMYSVGIVAICLREIFLRCFYALKKNKEVIIINIVNILVNIALNAIFIKRLGHSGLALATSLSSIVVLPIYIYILGKEKVLEKKEICLKLMRNILICIPSIIIMIIIKKMIVFPDKFALQTIYFIFTFIVSMIVYIPIIFINKKINIKKV